MKSVQGFAQRSDTETLHESFQVHGILYLLHVKTVLHSRCLLKAKLGTESAKKLNFIITSHCCPPVLPAFQAEPIQLLLSSALGHQHTFCIWRCSSGGWCFEYLPAQWLTPVVRIIHLSLSFQKTRVLPGAASPIRPRHPSHMFHCCCTSHLQLFVPLHPGITLLFAAQPLSRNLR